MRNSPVAEALWRRLDRDFAEQLAGTTPPKAPGPLNQCDGCNAGMPITNGIHRNYGQAHMVCTAAKYQLPRPWPAREGAEL